MQNASLLFCVHCGNLWNTADLVRFDSYKCESCSVETDVTKLHLNSSTPRMSRQHYPRTWKHLDSSMSRLDDVSHAPTIKENCPNCGKEEMNFHTLQLRSADEGATVFYSCSCGYRSKQNN